MLFWERCIMEDLSIVIRASEDNVYEYVRILEPILSCSNCELIIINNVIDKMDIKYNHTLYKFSGSSSKFKEFCFASSIGSKIMIIDGNIQLGSSFVNDVMMHLKASDFYNTAYKFRRFLSSDKPIHYVDNQVLIYNRGIKGFNVESQIAIDDFTLIDNDYMEINLNKFIEAKSFNELYLWYKNFILKNTLSFKQKFYLLLESEKIKLCYEDTVAIEELFIIGNEDLEYCEYLSMKKELFKKNTMNLELLSERINLFASFNNTKYYFWLLYHIIKDRKDLLAVIFTLDKIMLKDIIDYLFSCSSFHEYLYDFILEINQIDNESEKYKFSITNLILISSYITHVSMLPTEPELKNRLLKLWEAYIKVYEKLLEDENVPPNTLEELTEEDIITKFNEALRHVKQADINKAVEILKSLCIEYPSYDRVLRYYIQRMQYENSYYPFIISVCMIVKDEEKNLVRCLSSLKPLFSLPSELIIVDTGSTDRTIEIARKYSQNIYLYKWKGSFSDARNYSLSLVAGEYIFLLDADEEIEGIEIEKLVNEFKTASYKLNNTYTLKLKNYTDVGLKEHAIITQPRIFKNNLEFYYSGTVHNQPVFSLPIKHLPIYITHYGYIMTEDIKDKKFQRTANLLKVELQKNPKNIYYRFQLSTSYAMHGDLKEALSQVKIYMRSIRDENIISDNYLMHYNNAVILYMSSHLLEEAAAICDEALKIKPEFIDFIYYKGLINFELEDYEAALDYTNKYLALIDNFRSIDVANDGRYSFYTLGLKNDVIKMHMLCHHRLGNWNEIINTLNSFSSEVRKDYLHVIINSYLKAGRYSDVINFYNTYCYDNNLKYIFRYFLEDYIQKSDKTEQQICITILTTLNCYDGYTVELKNIKDHKDYPDINQALYVIENYDIDSLDINEARRLFTKLLPAYNSFIIEKSTNIIEVFKFKKLGSYILHRSEELKRYRDYSIEKLINILRKYMNLSSYLIINKRSNLLEAREQLFLIKITEAFKQLGIKDYDRTISLLNESIEIYRPMEGLIKLILKNVIPNYKASNNNPKPVRVISEDSENIESYATLVKKKILEDVDKKSTKDIIETFKEFNRIELYDSELFSYKAVLLMSDGMLEDAELELNEGLRRYPNDIRLLSNLCRLYSLTQNFNKSLEIFCSVKMLSRGKCELELNQLIPHEYYDVNTGKLKVLHGTMYPDNTINKVAAELSKKGIYAKTLSYCPKYTGYSSDYCIDMNQYEDGCKILSKTLDAAACLIPKFDIFHFHYGSTLTFDYSDLPLLNELGKKVIVQFWGDEVNKTSAPSKVNSYSLYKDKEKLTSISKYVSLCIVPNEEIYMSVKEFFKEIYIIQPNDIDKLIDLYKSLF